VGHHPLGHLTPSGEVPMPRFRFRLATLGLLIVIIALAAALVVQWRRQEDLRLQIRKLEIEKDVLQELVARQQRLLQARSGSSAFRLPTRSGSSGSSSLPSGASPNADRNQPTDEGRAVRPP